MNQFTSFSDVEEVPMLLEEVKNVKENPFADQSLGVNKVLGLVFFNNSLRTRMSTQKAAMNLGMQVMILNVQNDGWQLELQEGAIMNGSSQEHIADAVQMMSLYCHIIGVRTFAGLQDKALDYEEHVLNNFLKYSKVPVISLESATRHPLQSLADLVTIIEHAKNDNPKIVLSWAPHPKALPQAVANSFCEWILGVGLSLTITHPVGFELAEEFTQGAKIETDQHKAIADADFVYVKNWSSYSSYGQTGEFLHDWMITKDKMLLTNDAHFMHCLPIRRNVIATDEILDGDNSLVLEQANNRTFAAQAVLKNILKNEN